METLTRGELAGRCEVNFETIRYYEQQGLILKPARSAGNYRLYPADAVRRVRFIRRAQDLGFTLREIKELLALRASPRTRCGQVYARAQAKIANIDEKLKTLRAMRRALAHLMSDCGGGAGSSVRPPPGEGVGVRRSGAALPPAAEPRRRTSCPILEALDDEGHG